MPSDPPESSPRPIDDAELRPGTDSNLQPPSGELFASVYKQLRSLAQQHMNAENSGHTLSATALVHEAYVRLAGSRQVPWQNRGHFYTAAAQAMRRILIDHARAKGARGGSLARIAELPDVAALATADPEQFLAVDAAVARLESEDTEAAAIVWLRFFAGLSVDEAADALGISLSPRNGLA